jgi:membrane associated rhomboid family serine protease
VVAWPWEDGEQFIAFYLSSLRLHAAKARRHSLLPVNGSLAVLDALEREIQTRGLDNDAHPHYSYSRGTLDRTLVSYSLLSQVGAIAEAQSGGVAYTAHVGGFIFGTVTARMFERFGRAEE